MLCKNAQKRRTGEASQSNYHTEHIVPFRMLKTSDEIIP